MASQSQAYDLSRYEPKVAEQPKVRVIKRAQPVKSVYGVRPITLVMASHDCGVHYSAAIV